jgi:hypothetical protein
MAYCTRTEALCEALIDKYEWADRPDAKIADARVEVTRDVVSCDQKHLANLIAN